MEDFKVRRFSALRGGCGAAALIEGREERWKMFKDAGDAAEGAFKGVRNAE